MPHWRIQVPQEIDEPYLESTAILEEMEVWRCLIQCPALIATEAPHYWIRYNINMSTCWFNIRHDSSACSPYIHGETRRRISSRSETTFQKSFGQNTDWTKTEKQFEKKQHINQTLIKSIVQTHKNICLNTWLQHWLDKSLWFFLRLKKPQNKQMCWDSSLLVYRLNGLLVY